MYLHCQESLTLLFQLCTGTRFISVHKYLLQHSGNGYPVVSHDFRFLKCDVNYFLGIIQVLQLYTATQTTLSNENVYPNRKVESHGKLVNVLFRDVLFFDHVTSLPRLPVSEEIFIIFLICNNFELSVNTSFSHVYIARSAYLGRFF